MSISCRVLRPGESAPLWQRGILIEYRNFRLKIKTNTKRRRLSFGLWLLEDYTDNVKRISFCTRAPYLTTRVFSVCSDSQSSPTYCSEDLLYAVCMVSFKRKGWGTPVCVYIETGKLMFLIKIEVPTSGLSEHFFHAKDLFGKVIYRYDLLIYFVSWH